MLYCSLQIRFQIGRRAFAAKLKERAHLPNNVRLSLRDACTIQVGYTARRRLVPVADGGIAAIRLQDVQPGCHVDPGQLVRVRTDRLSGKHLVRAGDVVFRSRSHHNTATALGDEFGEPALALLPLFILRPRCNIILPEFLAWTINQPAAQRHFDRVALGTNMRMVSRSGLSRLEMDVPGIETQRGVVAVDDLSRRERDLSLRVANRRRTWATLILNDLAKGSNVNHGLRQPRHRGVKSGASKD